MKNQPFAGITGSSGWDCFKTVSYYLKIQSDLCIGAEDLWWFIHESMSRHPQQPIRYRLLLWSPGGPVLYHYTALNLLVRHHVCFQWNNERWAAHTACFSQFYVSPVCLLSAFPLGFGQTLVKANWEQLAAGEGVRYGETLRGICILESMVKGCCSNRQCPDNL